MPKNSGTLKLFENEGNVFENEEVKGHKKGFLRIPVLNLIVNYFNNTNTATE